jgi:hypothetical protein
VALPSAVLVIVKLLLPLLAARAPRNADRGSARPSRQRELTAVNFAKAFSHILEENARSGSNPSPAEPNAGRHYWRC